MKENIKHLPFSLCLLGLPDLQKVIVIPYARTKHETDLSKIPNRCVSVNIITLFLTEKQKETCSTSIFSQCIYG